MDNAAICVGSIMCTIHLYETFPPVVVVVELELELIEDGLEGHMG